VGSLRLASSGSAAKFIRVNPNIALAIQPATSFTAASSKGHDEVTSKNARKYCKPRAPNTQRQSRLINKATALNSNSSKTINPVKPLSIS
jgi:hypothetical protein